MAKIEQKPAAAQSCPVAAIGAEFRRLHDIDAALDEAYAVERDVIERGRIDRLRDNNFDFMTRGLCSAASYLPAKSPQGALLQLGFLSDFIDDVVARIDTESDKEAGRIESAIGRFIHSIADFLEDSTGARREDVGADYFLRRDISPFAMLDEAGKVAAEGSSCGLRKREAGK